MSEIADFILAQYTRIEAAARAAMHDGRGVWTHTDLIRRTGAIEDDRGEPVVYDEGSPTSEQAAHIVGNDPAYVLTDIASKRQIIDVVMSWQHEYIDGDTWFSCGLAESPDFPGEGPGSGCADDSRRGTCDCGLEYRQRRILAPLAAPFSGEPGFKPEWAV